MPRRSGVPSESFGGTKVAAGLSSFGAEALSATQPRSNAATATAALRRAARLFMFAPGVAFGTGVVLRIAFALMAVVGNDLVLGGVALELQMHGPRLREHGGIVHGGRIVDGVRVDQAV